jgi:hypothetical protein
MGLYPSASGAAYQAIKACAPAPDDRPDVAAFEALDRRGNQRRALEASERGERGYDSAVGSELRKHAILCGIPSSPHRPGSSHDLSSEPGSGALWVPQLMDAQLTSREGIGGE